MGHQRLGKLPASRRLPEIVRYLVTGGTPTADLVDQVTEVGREALKSALKDPVFIEALWLLVRMPQAAARKDFVTALAEIGIADASTTTDILVSYNGALEKLRLRQKIGLTDLGEIANCAAVAALAKELSSPLPTLWAPTTADIWAPVAAFRRPEKFGDLAQLFYANFIERVIHYYVDRCLHKIVGPERVARSIHDLRLFNLAIRRHCDEAALIMRAFAKDWLGKNHYNEGKEISREDVRKFSAYVTEKIGKELNLRKGAQ